jgi:cytoskeletal protein RodZ
MRLGFIGQKAIAIVAGGALVSMAAVGAFASQEFVTIEEETPTVEVTETATEEPTASATAEPTEEPTEEATEEPTEEATEEPTEEATEEPTEEPTEEATEEPEGEEEGDGQREIGGIPENHPVYHDGEGGKCAAIKTTPSGRQVRVPCHAAGVDDEGATTQRGKGKKNGGDDE